MISSNAYAPEPDPGPSALDHADAREHQHRSPRLCKSDRPRAIDRYIDYFGEVARERHPVRETGR